jgi:hypothetical protein
VLEETGLKTPRLIWEESRDRLGIDAKTPVDSTPVAAAPETAANEPENAEVGTAEVTANAAPKKNSRDERARPLPEPSQAFAGAPCGSAPCRRLAISPFLICAFRLKSRIVVAFPELPRRL